MYGQLAAEAVPKRASNKRDRIVNWPIGGWEERREELPKECNVIDNTEPQRSDI